MFARPCAVVQGRSRTGPFSKNSSRFRLLNSTRNKRRGSKWASLLLHPAARMCHLTAFGARGRRGPCDFSPTRTLRCFWNAILALACLYLGLASRAYAGGSGLNTIVIVNQLSSNSCEVANYFCERRQVPPENVLRINWAGGNTSWSRRSGPWAATARPRRSTARAESVARSVSTGCGAYFA